MDTKAEMDKKDNNDLIVWSDELCLGIPSIDQQHQEMVKIVNRVQHAIDDKKGHDFILLILDELIKDTLAHFDYEEALFKKYDYKETKSHVETHQNLVDQVSKLHETMDEDNYVISSEVMAFLEYWLIFHILKTDTDYAEFLIEKGVK